LVDDGACSVWIDNFSKSLKYGVPSLIHGIWQQCLWSVWGCTKAPSGIDLTVDLAKPALPQDLLEPSLIKTMFKMYETILHESWERYEISNCKYASRIPLGDNPVVRCTKFTPLKVTAQNPASNAGLSQLLAHFHQQFAPKSRYYVLLVDINLYSRIIKVFTTTFHFTSR
jgi:hypothetical protein